MKKNKAEKRITICVQQELFDQFQELCDKHYLSMSEALRSHIKACVDGYRPDNYYQFGRMLSGTEYRETGAK